jgi:hypothetical protein
MGVVFDKSRPPGETLEEMDDLFSPPTSKQFAYQPGFGEGSSNAFAIFYLFSIGISHFM